MHEAQRSSHSTLVWCLSVHDHVLVGVHQAEIQTRDSFDRLDDPCLSFDVLCVRPCLLFLTRRRLCLPFVPDVFKLIYIFLPFLEVHRASPPGPCEYHGVARAARQHLRKHKTRGMLAKSRECGAVQEISVDTCVTSPRRCEEHWFGSQLPMLLAWHVDPQCPCEEATVPTQPT